LASSLRGFRDQMNRFSDDFINLAEKQLAER
jgi:hypothetical protein